MYPAVAGKGKPKSIQTKKKAIQPWTILETQKLNYNVRKAVGNRVSARMMSAVSSRIAELSDQSHPGLTDNALLTRAGVRQTTDWSDHYSNLQSIGRPNKPGKGH